MSKRLSPIVAAITLDALADKASAYEAAITAAFERMAAGDLSAEADADAALVKLETVTAQMAEIEAGMFGASKARAEIAAVLAA